MLDFYKAYYIYLVLEVFYYNFISDRSAGLNFELVNYLQFNFIN
jgi:hypothetical protein